VLQLWIQSFFLLLQPSMSSPLMRKTLDAKLMQVLHYIHENIYDVENYTPSIWQRSLLMPKLIWAVCLRKKWSWA
jgi:hypothetical protein